MTRRRFVLPAACAAILAGCSPPPAESPIDNRPLSGRQIFLARCAVCHQPDGSGIPGLYPPLSSSARLAGSPEKPVRIVLLGLKGPQLRNGTTYNGIMPSWRFDLTDSQISSVLNDMIERWLPGTPPIPDDLVATVRSRTASEKLFPSPEEVDGTSPP